MVKKHSNPLMRRIDLDEAKNQLLELIEQVEAGQEIVLTRDNQPIVHLVAAQKKRIRQFGSAKGLIKMSDDFDEPLDDFKDYM